MWKQTACIAAALCAQSCKLLRTILVRSTCLRYHDNATGRLTSRTLLFKVYMYVDVFVRSCHSRQRVCQRSCCGLRARSPTLARMPTRRCCNDADARNADYAVLRLRLIACARISSGALRCARVRCRRADCRADKRVQALVQGSDSYTRLIQSDR